MITAIYAEQRCVMTPDEIAMQSLRMGCLWKIGPFIVRGLALWARANPTQTFDILELRLREDNINLFLTAEDKSATLNYPRDNTELKYSVGCSIGNDDEVDYDGNFEKLKLCGIFVDHAVDLLPHLKADVLFG